MPSIQEIMVETEGRMGKSVDALSRELDAIRTGRASPALLDNLTVDYYGAPTPLNQIASISVPEPRVLMVQPWDKQALQAIEKGILKSDLGLVPNTDGTVVRIVIPTLTEERRRDLVRVVKAKVEESHVATRNVRRDSLEKLRAEEKNKTISKDEGRRAQTQLQQVTDAHISRMDALGRDKETEVMEV